MIVDVHHHFMHGLPRERFLWISKVVEHAAKRTGRSFHAEAFFDHMQDRSEDPAGEKLIAWMDESGIDFTCLCMLDHFQYEAREVQDRNRVMGQIAHKYPKRLMAFAAVDPRRPNAPDMLKQCFEEFGVQGLKYHPDYGYDPAGLKSYKLLEIVQRNRGILLSHTGFIQPPARPRFSDPLMLSDLAVDFPDIRVIAAHMGMANWRPWAGLAEWQPNFYGDLAMWDAYAFGNYEFFCRELRDILNYGGAKKVLFGTDSPVFGTLFPVKEWLRLLKDLPEKSPENIRFSREEIEGILGFNAADLLNLRMQGAPCNEECK